MKHLRSLLALLVLICAGSLGAQELDVVEHTLDNGLQLFIHENPRSSSVECRITYRVGSADEWAGVTGISHFLEHLMFKGTTTINAVDYEREAELLKREDDIRAALQSYQDQARKQLESGEALSEAQVRELALLRYAATSVQAELAELADPTGFDNLWASEGATGLNASTSWHRTTYTVNLPANKLELFFWVEADRLQRPVFREFYRERDVVTDERLLYTSSPSGRTFESMLNTIFEGSQYNFPRVGWPDDLARYTRPQVIDYFKRFYRPDNAAIVLSGNIKAADAIAFAEYYFGTMETPDTPVPSQRTSDIEPLGKRELRGETEVPMLAYAWQLPGAHHPDAAALEMIISMLNSQSGPLWQRFVDTGEAQAAGAFTIMTGDVGFFALYLSLADGKDPEDFRPRVRELLQELELGGLPAASLQQAQRAILMAQIQQLESDPGIADLLSEGWVEGGWRQRAERVSKASQLTLNDIAAVVATHLSMDHVIVGIFDQASAPSVEHQRIAPIDGVSDLVEALSMLDSDEKAALADELTPLLNRAGVYFTAEHFAARSFYDRLLNSQAPQPMPKADAPHGGGGEGNGEESDDDDQDRDGLDDAPICERWASRNAPTSRIHDLLSTEERA